MVDPQKIGTVVYSKRLDRNFEIIRGPSDEFWRSVGLESVLIQEPKKEKIKFPKVDPDITDNEQ